MQEQLSALEKAILRAEMAQEAREELLRHLAMARKAWTQSRENRRLEREAQRPRRGSLYAL